MEVLEWFLRLFGLFWMLGGVLIFNEMRRMRLIDEAIEKITLQSEDKLDQYYGFASAVLTVTAGIALLLLLPVAPYIIVSLVLVQAFYFSLQRRRYNAAEDEEEKLDATVSSKSRNAFIVSLVVMCLSLWFFSMDLK